MATIYTAHRKETLGDYPLALYTGSGLRVMYDTVTLAAAGGATALTIVFPKLLPGKVIVYPSLSWIRADDAGAGADLHLGYAAYVDSTDTTVAADDNYWMDNVDVGAADVQGLWTAITGITTAGARPTVFDAQDGLQIQIMVDTADADVNDVYSLFVVYGHVQ